MKRFVSLMLCGLVLLLTLTACGEEGKSSYQKALDAIEAEDYATAYTLLKESKDRRAPELLEKFTFVPLKCTQKSSLGADGTTVYTYDDLGNLLSKKTAGSEGERLYEYTYSGYKMTSLQFQSSTNAYGHRYAYDSAGNLVQYWYLDRNSNWVRKTTYTYDEQNRCLSEETLTLEDTVDLNPELESTRYYTYDTEGRTLSMDFTYYNVYDEDVVTERYTYYYTYEADGSYCEVLNGIYSYLSYTQTTYYNAEGEVLRFTRENSDGEYYPPEEEEYRYECRYNERGDLEYRHSIYGDTEKITTYVYDDQGRLLERDTTDPEGEPIQIERNTYDERGNQLTHEEVDCESNSWSKTVCTYDDQNHLVTRKETCDDGWEDITYTYDEKGNKIAEAKEGSFESYNRTFEYDEWGNVTALFRYSNVYDTEYAYEQTAQWELRYYPKGIPEEVQYAIEATQVD